MAPRSAQTAEKRSKLVHGAQRAKAWVHMVINPLLESLPIEVSFLERCNTTWRHNNRRLELIRTVEIYLAPDARHVLRDYLRANPRNKRHFNRHDDLLTEIVEAATLAHSALLANPGFQDELATATRSFGIAEPGRVAQADSASSYITADLIAERVVN